MEQQSQTTIASDINNVKTSVQDPSTSSITHLLKVGYILLAPPRIEYSGTVVNPQSSSVSA
jgi:hypothetical protein